MATFFHGESEMREASSDPFMMNMNPFPDPTTTISAHNNHLYNLCFGSQQHPRQVSKLEQEHSSMSTVSNGGVTQTLRALGPVYLRAAQELLNEIVNVGNGNCCTKQEPRVNKDKVIYGMYDGVGDIKGGGHMADGDTCRQELQIKKAKLISMVEKVEQRYKQYHEQMQTIVSPFEQAAGLGSASAYTYMALQTISKQFRAVKDMICLQIKHINKLLGEKECEQLKRLGKIPHHHSNVWRPQRGLPETAVSVLRAWLFQHFLHPYPRDLDKEMLAKQTGLTKSQVSNWFINARVRVWKPMVEEMYLEEMNTEETRKRGNNKCSSSKQPYNNTTTEESSNSMLPVFHQGFIGNETSMQTSSSTCNVVTFKKQHVNQANLIHFNGCFENYHPTVGNRVSLSLGLPHSCDQTFNNIHFGSTSHGTEISGIYPTSTYQIMD